MLFLILILILTLNLILVAAPRAGSCFFSRTGHKKHLRNLRKPGENGRISSRFSSEKLNCKNCAFQSFEKFLKKFEKVLKKAQKDFQKCDQGFSNFFKLFSNLLSFFSIRTRSVQKTKANHPTRPRFPHPIHSQPVENMDTPRENTPQQRMCACAAAGCVCLRQAVNGCCTARWQGPAGPWRGRGPLR